MEQAEGNLKRGISKRKRKQQENEKEKKSQRTKAGKEILYSASPGGEKNRYHNTEFETPHNNKITPSNIFSNTTTIDNDK